MRSICKDCDRLYEIECSKRPGVKEKRTERSRRRRSDPNKWEEEKKRSRTPEARQKRRNRNALPEVKNRKREHDKKYYLGNTEAIKQHVSEYQSSPRVRLKIKSRHKKRCEEEPNYRLACALRTRLAGVIREGNKKGSAVRDLGCAVPELRSYLESKFQSGMSWENYGYGKGKWNIDHIFPLSAFNLTDPQHLLLACNHLNLQPLWHEDNMSKGDTYPNFS